MKPTGKDNPEFKIWDDLTGSTRFPQRFEVFGWDAEIIPNNDAGALGIMRVRFSKEGYRPMDMAVTYQLLTDASPGQLRDMFSEKVMSHQRAQEKLGAMPFTLKKKVPPPNAPSGALYAEDGEFGKPSNLTIKEIGIKTTISDLGYAAMMAPMVKKDLYSAMFPQAWVKTAELEGPDAKDEGDWA